MPVNTRILFATIGLPLFLVLVGCTAQPAPTTNSVSSGDSKVALISITSDPESDPQAVNMGLTFAGFCLDEGYDVAIFFNVKGTKLPTASFPADFKYQEHDPMTSQLKSLQQRGVELHVCPVCMNDLKITESDIIEEAFVTSKPKLFSKLGSDTVVFTY